MKKGTLIVAYCGLVFVNYLLWAVVLKPLGLTDSLASLNSAMGGMVSAKQAGGYSAVYAVAKTVVYLATTGTLLFLLARKGTYKNYSMGSAVLACTAIALAFDFINMTLLPACLFYTLGFGLLCASSEKPASQVLSFEDRRAA